jgi:hypothetical protein
VGEPFQVWIAAVEAGFVPLPDLVRWADDQVMGRDTPPRWLLDISLAGTADQAVEALWRGLADHAERFGAPPGPDPARLYLGFLYLRFRRGDLGLAELLSRAGGKADGADCGVGCEAFYLLLNEVDGRGPARPSRRPLAERVGELFAPFAQLAEGYLRELPAQAAEPLAAPDAGRQCG